MTFLLPPSTHPPPHATNFNDLHFTVLQDGLSPLVTASDGGHFDVVKTLIEAGADINLSDKVGVCTVYKCTLCNALVPPVLN